MAVTTQEDVGRLLQVTFGTPDDPRVGEVIAAAQAAVEVGVGIPFDLTPSDITTLLDVRGDETIRLPRWPIRTVTSITEDGTVLVDGDDVVWYSDGNLVRLPGPWPYGRKMVEVVYTAGWTDETEAPSELRWLVAGVAARLWQSGVAFAENQGASGIVQETIGGYSATYGAFAQDVAAAMQLTDDERARCKAMRRSRIGAVSS